MNILSVYETNIFQALYSLFNSKIGFRIEVFFSDIYSIYRPKSTNKYPLRSIWTLSKPYYQRNVLAKKAVNSRYPIAFVVYHQNHKCLDSEFDNRILLKNFKVSLHTNFGKRP